MFLLRNLLPDNLNVNFLKVRYVGLALSGLLIIATFYGFFAKGLNLGIDFRGGILIEARFQTPPSLDLVRKKLNSLNIGEVTIQTMESSKDLLIKAGYKEGQNVMDNAALVQKTIKNKIYSKVEFRKVEYVGAEVGAEMIGDGTIAVLLTFIGIMLYVWYRFNWQYSIGIVIGLIHDVILTMGYLIYMDFEFNITCIAAILTILGYSVNDTVVMYDRIRENLYNIRKKPFIEILNLSINETVYRTLFTMLTTLLAAGALVVYGGEALKSFSVTVFAGIVIGTYSSVFISIPILSFFKNSVTRRK
ncbi:MAG: protein translocase subunit SecF [Rickettsiales bacterium]